MSIFINCYKYIYFLALCLAEDLPMADCSFLSACCILSLCGLRTCWSNCACFSSSFFLNKLSLSKQLLLCSSIDSREALAVVILVVVSRTAFLCCARSVLPSADSLRRSVCESNSCSSPRRLVLVSMDCLDNWANSWFKASTVSAISSTWTCNQRHRINKYSSEEMRKGVQMTDPVSLQTRSVIGQRNNGWYLRNNTPNTEASRSYRS